MHCQPCAVGGHEHPAVGLCPSCSAGLCLEHRIEQEQYVGPGGTSYACGHQAALTTGQGRRERRGLRAA